MRRKIVVALMQLAPVWAGLQDISRCDPREADSKCAPNPAFAGNAVFDLANVNTNDDLGDFWTVDASTVGPDRQVDLDSDPESAIFNVWSAGEAPTLTSKKYLFFGRVSVEVQAARGRGVVTTIMLKSDTGDELDWNLLGAYDTQVQAAYFFNGNEAFKASNYTFDLPTSSCSRAHTYAVEWTEKHVSFFIDGERREILYVGDIPPEKWPQTPMQVKVGAWAVDDDDDDDESDGGRGVVDWAGGLPSWDDAPFQARFGKVEIEDYMGGCRETKGGDDAVEYSYDENFNGWRDVMVKGCKKRLVPGMITPLESSTEGPAPTATAGTGHSQSQDAFSTSGSGRTTTTTTTTTTAYTGSAASQTSATGITAPTSTSAPASSSSTTGEPEAPPSETEGMAGANQAPVFLLATALLLFYGFLR